MRQIINSESLSYDQIQQNLQDFKASLPYYEEIKRNTPASVLQLIDDLISEFGSLLNYKYQMLRRETYLSTASLESSIISISSTLGYNINRPTCPLISLQYNAIPTIQLRQGDIVGTLIDGTPIVYFGENRYLEKGDIVQYCVGYYNSTTPATLDTFLSNLGDYQYLITPTLAPYVDNKYIKIYTNTSLSNISRDAEDYVVGASPRSQIIRVTDTTEMLSLVNVPLNSIVYNQETLNYYTLINADYTLVSSWRITSFSASLISNNISGTALDHSNDLSSTSIFICNRTYYQGLSLSLTDDITLTWIETSGYRKIFITDPIVTSAPYDSMTMYSIDSLGTSGDDLNRVKLLAPLFYSALKRAVTEADHKYILEANEYLSSVEVKKDWGIPEQGVISFNSKNIDDVYSITLGTLQEVTYTVLDTDVFVTTAGVLSVMDKLKYIIESTGLALVTIVDDTLQIITAPQVVLSGYTVNNTLIYTQVVAVVKPECCTINAYYVNKTTVSDPIPLTVVEQTNVANYMVRYKMVGSAIRLIPATRVDYHIQIQVKILNPSYYDEVYQQIVNILNGYILVLNTTFVYGKFLADVAKIQIDPTNSGYPINPIVYVLPNQTVFDIKPSTNSYITFTFNKEDMNVLS